MRDNCAMLRYSDGMRQHELLYFVDSLTSWLKRPPTREEVSYNFWLNHQQFVGGNGAMRGTLRQLRVAHAIKEGRCDETGCHAKHVRITAKGRALLDYWNQHGCDSEHRGDSRCERGNVHFREMPLAS